MIIPRPTSRLVGTPIITDADGQDLYEIRQPIAFRAVPGMLPVTVRANDTAHSLAFRYYGDAQLFWVIAEFNGIFDVTTEMPVGDTVVIPPLDFVEDFLAQREA